MSFVIHCHLENKFYNMALEKTISASMKATSTSSGISRNRGTRVLPTKAKTSRMSLEEEEYLAIQKEMKDIETWWKDSRWDHTRRPYSGNIRHVWHCYNVYFVSCSSNHFFFISSRCCRTSSIVCCKIIIITIIQHSSTFSQGIIL